MLIENPCLALVFFARLEKCPNPLVLSLMVVNWLLSPSTRFQILSSAILTNLYDKTTVYRGIKAEFRVFLVDFLPFFFEVSYWTRGAVQVLASP